MCCCFRCSNKSALVVTRILIAILISQPLAIRRKSALGGSSNAGTNLGVCASRFAQSEVLPLARFPSLERASPNGSKICGRAVPVIELKNEFIGDIERDWQRNHWRPGAIGGNWRIVLDHGPNPPLLAFCAKGRRLQGRRLQTLSFKRSISCRERHDRIRGRFTPVRKWVPARPTKFGDQVPNRPTAMVQRLHQPIQTVSISFVPLFRNVGCTPPDGV